MWVTVERSRSLFGTYVGTLQNQPVFIDSLQEGDTVKFKPHHIAQTIIKKNDSNWIDSFGQNALVSALCFDEGEEVRFLYRENGDNPQDSGWRMFTGLETEEYNDDPKNIRIVEVGYMLDKDPSLLLPLKQKAGAVFERQNRSAEWQQVTDWQPPE